MAKSEGKKEIVVGDTLIYLPSKGKYIVRCPHCNKCEEKYPENELPPSAICPWCGTHLYFPSLY